MQYVLVLDTNRQPLAPCQPARARELLKSGKAAVFRKFPFTIILKKEVPKDQIDKNIEIKIDPGSKTTGIAIVSHGKLYSIVKFAMNLRHRGSEIKNDILKRRSVRRSRRNRKTRYRAARFNNRTKPAGWLAPSVMHRVLTISTWISKLMRLCSISISSVELVKFDIQKMENPEISGVEYQQGTLAGVELREYMIYKYNHECQYCKGQSNDQILEIDHIHPRSMGGSNRINNLILSCRKCNQLKSNLLLNEWLLSIYNNRLINKKYKESLLSNIPNVIKRKSPKSFKDTAVVNAIRYRLGDILSKITKFQYYLSWMTKYNRTRLKYPKDHWIDAACLGTSDVYISPKITPLYVYCKGHNNRQMVKMNKHGFPRTKTKTSSKAFGFKTGDMVKAVIPDGKYSGIHFGRIAVRKTGRFDIRTKKQLINTNYENLKLIHRADGYQYSYEEIDPLPTHVIAHTLPEAEEVISLLGGEVMNTKHLGRDVIVEVNYEM